MQPRPDQEENENVAKVVSATSGEGFSSITSRNGLKCISAATKGLMSLRSGRRAVRYSAMCAAIPRSAPGQRLSPANRHAHSSLPRTRPIEFRVSVRLSVSTERRTADQSTE